MFKNIHVKSSLMFSCKLYVNLFFHNYNYNLFLYVPRFYFIFQIKFSFHLIDKK